MRLLQKLTWFMQRLKHGGREVILFGSLAWPGAAVGSAAAVVLYMAYAGLTVPTGLSVIVNIAACVFLGALGTALFGLVFLLGATLTNCSPRLYPSVALGAITFFVLFGKFLGLPLGFHCRIGFALILTLAAAGSAFGIVFRRGNGIVRRSHRIAASVLMLVAISIGVGLAVWLADPGTDPHVEKQVFLASEHVPPLDARNPSEKGSHKVNTLFYGCGTDKRRKEYGKRVALKTTPVNAVPLTPMLKGVRAKVRKWFWGFGPDQFPLNGRVWFPEGKGPFPLVLIAHGDHQMEEFSDSGFAYLGELLASRGFIAVSVDENFLNISWSGAIGGATEARAWILLQHLVQWRTWNETQGNPFHGKVDLSNIALIGHSRGGEAIVYAAAFNRLSHYPGDANVRFDFNFSLKTLIALAPVDWPYGACAGGVPLENVNYLVLHGSHDSDVPSFLGVRPYQRLQFTDGQYRMKAACYVYRANHSHFNTRWGSYDRPFPMRDFVNRELLLTGDEQRRITKIYVTAFLEATLLEKKEYIPMFRDHRVIMKWLPKTICFSRFEDSTFRTVSNFENNLDITKTTVHGGVQYGKHLRVWRQQQLTGRTGWPLGNTALFLGWESAGPPPSGQKDVPCYCFTLPDGLAKRWALDARARLVFSLADTLGMPQKSKGRGPEKGPETTDAELDLAVELVAADGPCARVQLSQFHAVQPALRVRLTKWDYMERTFYKTSIEPVLQTFELPLSAFVAVNNQLDLANLKTIRFRFDRTKAGVIILDDVGFATEI